MKARSQWKNAFNIWRKISFPNWNYTQSQTINQTWNYNKVFWQARSQNFISLYRFSELAPRNRKVIKKKNPGLKKEQNPNPRCVGGWFLDASGTPGVVMPFILKQVRRLWERILWDDTRSGIPNVSGCFHLYVGTWLKALR